MKKFHFKFDTAPDHDSVLSEYVIEEFGCKVLDTKCLFSNSELIGGIRFVEVVRKGVTSLHLKFLEKTLCRTMGQEIVFEFDE